MTAPTMENWIGAAYGAFDQKEWAKAAQAAWHAAWAAHDAGLSITANPFADYEKGVAPFFTKADPKKPRCLRDEWTWAYAMRVKTGAEREERKRRAAEQQAAAPAQRAVEPTRSVEAPRAREPRPATTTSAAYAEQSGAVLVEERT